MSDSTAPKNLRSEYALACPRCGQAESLIVEVVAEACLTAEGTDIYDDHGWDGLSRCCCEPCGFSGRVCEFSLSSPTKVRS
jgi:hypothetical protein